MSRVKKTNTIQKKYDFFSISFSNHSMSQYPALLKNDADEKYLLLKNSMSPMSPSKKINHIEKKSILFNKFLAITQCPNVPYY